MSVDLWKWLLTVAVSIASGIIGAVWYFSGLIHRLEDAEKAITTLKFNQTAIYNSITAEPVYGRANVSFIRNANGGAVCDPGFAIKQLALSTEADKGDFTCIKLTHRVDGYKSH